VKDERSSKEAPSRCAALPYRMGDGGVEVLLVTARSTGDWIVPKGKIDRALGPRETAREEALEEAGVEGEIGLSPFDEYRHGGGDDDPLVAVFLLRVTRELPTWVEAEERDRAWMPIREAAGRVADPGLARILSAAGVHLATASPAASDGARAGSDAAPSGTARRAFTPGRLGLLVLAALGVVSLAAWALTSRQSGRRDGRDAVGVMAAAAEQGDRGGGPAGGAAAPGDSTCRVEGASVALPGRLSEASGIAAGRRSPGVLWSHNDSGEPLLYAFSPDGRALGEVRVTGAGVKDWEDVAAGPCASGSCLYLADIGDNAASRPSATVYRVPEPAPTDGQTRPAEAFHATYPDGPQDAEALFVLPDGGIYIVTKGETGPIAVYRFPQPLRAGAQVRLERVAELAGAATKRKDRITGASASPDGRWVALRTLGELALYRTADLLRGDVGAPIRVDLSSLNEPQGEGVGWGTGGTVYLSSESGKKNHPGSLARLSCTVS
jgi:8-oxo-dGTP pyrophosphatase MutT (NUDIX family)